MENEESYFQEYEKRVQPIFVLFFGTLKNRLNEYVLFDVYKIDVFSYDLFK